MMHELPKSVAGDQDIAYRDRMKYFACNTNADDFFYIRHFMIDEKSKLDDDPAG